MRRSLWLTLGSAAILGAALTLPGGRWGPCGPVNGVAQAQLCLLGLGAAGLGLGSIALAVTGMAWWLRSRPKAEKAR